MMTDQRQFWRDRGYRTAGTTIMNGYGSDMACLSGLTQIPKYWLSGEQAFKWPELVLREELPVGLVDQQGAVHLQPVNV